MGTITAIIASAIAGHLGGMAIGGTLASRGLLGFVAEAGKAAHAARLKRKHERAQRELADWLKENGGEGVGSDACLWNAWRSNDDPDRGYSVGVFDARQGYANRGISGDSRRSDRPRQLARIASASHRSRARKRLTVSKDARQARFRGLFFFLFFSLFSSGLYCNRQDSRYNS